MFSAQCIRKSLMINEDKRIFSMRIGFLKHLTEAMYITLGNGKDIPEESLEKLNEVATLVYQHHRRSSVENTK